MLLIKEYDKSLYREVVICMVTDGMQQRVFNGTKANKMHVLRSSVR